VAASLYGLARVYAGVHYPLDILAGAAIAAAVTYVVFRMRDVLMPLLMLAIRVARILRLA
jgi:membrane-associated phospholipid phosphatase